MITTAVKAAIQDSNTTPAVMIPMMITLLGGAPDDLFSLIRSLRYYKDEHANSIRISPCTLSHNIMKRYSIVLMYQSSPHGLSILVGNFDLTQVISLMPM